MLPTSPSLRSWRPLRSILLFLLPFTAQAQTIGDTNAELFKKLEAVHKLTPQQMQDIKNIFAGSTVMSQGNPEITRHALTTKQCEDNLKAKNIVLANDQFAKICGARFMAPLYNPKTQKPEDAKTCIDQFEFPNIPCTYPVVWVKAKEAQELCAAEGKRLCDAHEWEGACEGSLGPADYRFDLAKNAATKNIAVQQMRAAHNATHAKHWAYGDGYKKGICAANSIKDGGCNGGDWHHCGSNTYPTASFPDCKSSLQVYDQHGNAAEHMNLPLAENQMTSLGSKELGVTEMKGSWFIFDKFQAHPDYCRWRAPYWHGSPVMDSHSHENYHLGFRCCK